MGNKLYLKKNEERRLRAGHLWIYSNEIDISRSPLKSFKAGEIVTIFRASGEPLAKGYINPHSLIAVRILTKNINQEINQKFFKEKMEQALALRECFFEKPFYRLIYGESDGLPGLTIDRFEDIFSVQITTAGLESCLENIIESLIEIFSPKGIFVKNDSDARQAEQLEIYTKTVYGTVPDLFIIEENNLKFEVSLAEGQKTGCITISVKIG